MTLSHCIQLWRWLDGTEIRFDGLRDLLLAQAAYDKLEDGSFCGRIALCKGVIAFGSTLRECEETLHSTLEDY